MNLERNRTFPDPMKDDAARSRNRKISGKREEQEDVDPPIRAAHALFVLWVAGSVTWAIYAAMLAHSRGWWEFLPELGAILVLAPPILAHVLANFFIKKSGNPRL